MITSAMLLLLLLLQLLPMISILMLMRQQLRGNHLSKAACLTQVFFKHGEAYTPNLHTNIVDFRGLDSSTILI